MVAAHALAAIVPHADQWWPVQQMLAGVAATTGG
jgi:hypothetical protein